MGTGHGITKKYAPILAGLGISQTPIWLHYQHMKWLF